MDMVVFRLPLSLNEGNSLEHRTRGHGMGIMLFDTIAGRHLGNTHAFEWRRMFSSHSKAPSPPMGHCERVRIAKGLAAKSAFPG